MRERAGHSWLIKWLIEGHWDKCFIGLRHVARLRTRMTTRPIPIFGETSKNTISMLTRFQFIKPKHISFMISVSSYTKIEFEVV